MMEKRLTEITDQELLDKYDAAALHAGAGLAMLHTEMARRASDRAARTMTKLTQAITALTVIVTLVGICQLWFTVAPYFSSKPHASPPKFAWVSGAAKCSDNYNCNVYGIFRNAGGAGSSTARLTLSAADLRQSAICEGVISRTEAGDVAEISCPISVPGNGSGGFVGGAAIRVSGEAK